MEWMILPLRRYADFSGRSRRKEFWMFTLLNIIITIAVAFLLLALGLPTAAMGDASQMTAMVSGGAITAVMLLVFLWALAIFIPSIAVAVRRLHDRNLSGWWYLGVVIASLLPVIGFIVSIAFLVVMALPGTAGPNRFGPDPKDPAQLGVFA